jgi:hypothetical protein
MGTIIELPGGYQATLRDPKQIRERQRRLMLTSIQPLAAIYMRVPRELVEAAAKGDKTAIEAAEASVSGLIKNREEAANMSALKDAVIVALLQSWNVPAPLPDILTVQDLETEMYDALVEGTRNFAGEIMAASMPTDFSPTPDIEGMRETPFDESASSNGISKPEESAAKSTKKRPIAGVAIATGASIPD